MIPARQLISHSVEETLAFAKEFAATLKAGDVLALEGNLGSGKTTFVKGIALGLGLRDAGQVKSPTFVLMHIYPTAIPLYHFDLYRIDGSGDLDTLGFEDFLEDRGAISCVEWADRARLLIPESAVKIRFEVRGASGRYIHITHGNR